MSTQKYLGDEFIDFIQELIDGKRLNGSKEEGIAMLVIDKGFESLSDKQQYVFENAISHFVYDDCIRCGLDIPWSEMLAAEDNGGMCGWCQKLSRNDKD